MTRKQKKTLIRILAAAVLLIAAALLPVEGWTKLLVFLIPYLTAGWDVLWKAIRNIAHGQVFDENFLMAIATLGAFATGWVSCSSPTPWASRGSPSALLWISARTTPTWK